ncbi:MAG: hypothetical protein JSS87_14025 [Acidobacteria bacterium]|nr:hypothetical protein [Acidobacteriota bacterium]
MGFNRRSLMVFAATACVTVLLPFAPAQIEGPQRSHVVVRVQGDHPITTNDLHLNVEGKTLPVTSVRPLVEDHVPVELVVALDDGLRNFGNNLDSIKRFVASLPPNVSIAVGYMRNGRVMLNGGFHSSRDAAEHEIRLPMGSAGAAGSPYFCISDISKHWPSNKRAVRFVLMVTNGIDPYNGRPTPMNQDSPYVDTATTDAQRGGVTVYSIFWSSRAGGGFGYGGFSGESYLSDLSESTGGELLSAGTMNPPSIDSYLDRFNKALQRSYFVTFDAPTRGKNLSSLKVTTNARGVKLHAPREFHAGN